MEEDRSERKKMRKEMKRLRESFQYGTPTESCEMKVEVVEERETVEDDEDERKRRKREKKLKRRQEREQAEMEVNTSSRYHVSVIIQSICLSAFAKFC